MLWIAGIDYHRWIPLAVPGYLAAIGLSIAVMAFGKEYNGSKRWLSLGPFSFQPSEFSKVAVILFLAWLINRNVKISKLRIMSGMMLSILPVVGLVGASNLSTAIIILGIAVTLILLQVQDMHSLYGWPYQELDFGNFPRLGKLSARATCNLAQSGEV